jgi:O-antigen/teichoic acid export membrane protein
MSASPYAAPRMVLQAKWYALAKVGIAVVSLGTQLVLVRYLAVEDYAAYTLFVAGAGVLVFLTMFGMDRVIYRFMPPLREQLRWREAMVLMGGMLGARLALMAVLLAVLYLGAQWLLPRQIVSQLWDIRVHCAAYAALLAASESLVIFCNSLGLQRAQSGLFFLAGAIRMAAVGAVVIAATLTAAEVALVFAGTEALLVLALLAVLVRDIRRHPGAAAPGALVFGFTAREVARDSLSTQAAYLVGFPFKGALLKLVIGAVSPPVVTAAFGFFQTMADRAYQFMPVFLLKGMLEPALANDFAARGDAGRVRMTVSLLLRLNFLIIFLGIAVLAGCGAPLVDWITRGRYGGHMLLAILISIQLLGMTLGECMFFALNPLGRVARHNRLWMMFALPFLGLLAASAMSANAHLLVVVATLPYLVVYGWLRWVGREQGLEGGLGMSVAVMVRLGLAAAAGAGAARVVLLAPVGWPAVVGAGLTAALVYVLALRLLGFFHLHEVDSVDKLSPRLAQLLRPFATA